MTPTSSGQGVALATSGMSRAERRHLATALALASVVGPSSSPNPAVGCVLVRDGAVVGQGSTGAGGTPHAEAAALARAGDAARGATAHVTLEPCVHHGRTPPCALALAVAGVQRVVVGHPDPNPVAAGGTPWLRNAGVEVVVAGRDDVVREAIARQLEGFLVRVALGRPHVTLKVAQTTDGRLVAPAGTRWITGVAARRGVHRMRAAVDAVLVGAGTVEADDPRLDAREVPVSAQPRPVVLDTTARTPPTARVVGRGALVVTGPAPPPDRVAALRAAGAEVVAVALGADGRVEPAAALAMLGARGITTVLAEPGATLAEALLRAGLVDRLVLHVAAGRDDGPPMRALAACSPLPWRTERAGGAGADAVLHLAARRPPVDTVATDTPVGATAGGGN